MPECHCASNILKPALARGSANGGATTLNEYQKYIETDAALERRFAELAVRTGDTMNLKLKDGLQHQVFIPDETMVKRLNFRAVCYGTLPDKAIDIMDEAAAKS